MNSSATDHASDEEPETFRQFLYLPLRISNLEVSSLLDTGNTVNVMSSQFFNSIPDSFKSNFNPAKDKITLAINQSMPIFETADQNTRPTRKTLISCVHLSVNITSINIGYRLSNLKNNVLDFSYSVRSKIYCQKSHIYSVKNRNNYFRESKWKYTVRNTRNVSRQNKKNKK